MRHQRISLLMKISQDLNSLSQEGMESKKRLMEEILKELGLEIQIPAGGEFKPDEAKLAEIEKIKQLSDEELKDLDKMIELLSPKSPEEGRQLTNDLSKQVEGYAKNLGTITASLSNSQREEEIFFEALFKSKFKKLADEQAVDIICDDLRVHGTFKLYHTNKISKKASSYEDYIKKNIRILNSRVEQYSEIDKRAQIFDWSKLKNLSSGALKGAVSALSNVGGSMLSGAWKALKVLGKGLLRILPIISIIWDVWDLFSYAYKSLNIWFSEFAKYNKYGSPSELADVTYLEQLYEKHKDDLEAVLEITKIVNLSLSFDDGWVMGITSFLLVIEDIVTLLIDLTGVGMVIDVAVSLGILAGGKAVSYYRSLAFENLKRKIGTDVTKKYESLDSVKQVAEQAQNAVESVGSFS